MPHERRLTIRKTPDYLAYLSLPPNNGGIVVDVSEGGLGFRAIAPVQADGPIHFRFAIDSAARIRAVGELAWIDEAGKVGGLRFTDLPDEVREQIRVWATQSGFRARANPKARVCDIPNAEPAIQARVEAAPGSKINLAAGSKAGHPLLYNLKPPIYSAPFNELSMFPLGLNFEAEASAVAAPQMVQSLDRFRDLPRVWPGQTRPKVKGRVGPRLKVNVGMRSETRIHHDVEAVESKMKAVPAPRSDSDRARVVATGHPFPYTMKPPVYSAPSYGLSMFPLESDSEKEATDGAVPATVAMRHPIAAIGLTIALAFVVSVGIFSYLTTSRAGEWLFDWGEKMWSGSYSQTMPGDPAPPASSAPNSLKIRPQ
jgi:hypothetical protein